MNRIKLLRLAVTLLILLALFVVMLGAYTRLTDAGLGCPDWPGCYGKLVLPSAQSELSKAQASYPHIRIESVKAWTEMAHRYVAGTLGLSIFCMALYVFFHTRKAEQDSSVRTHKSYLRLNPLIPCILVLLVIFQALLGMWTVTLKLLPVVVMAHLLGGILIFESLVYFRLQISKLPRQPLAITSGWLKLGIIILFCQIALGGWVSSNYAGIACIGFPQCNGTWWPKLHLSQAFNVISNMTANYQGGLLEPAVRVTIQFIHRLGAYVTATYLLTLALTMMYCIKSKLIRSLAATLICLLLVQVLLGVINVIYLLPLWVAVAHNGVAALLLANLLSLHYLTRSERNL